jgi:hypothetical protein
MINFLHRAVENLVAVRPAIDALKKMDIEQTRMRYCSQEFNEVQSLKASLTTGFEESNEIMYWNKDFH